jgi:hypothetical protein
MFMPKKIFGEIVFDNDFHKIKKVYDDVKDDDDLNNGKIDKIYKEINDVLYIGITCTTLNIATCVCVCVCVCMIRLRKCVHVCMYLCVCVCVCMCVCVCVCVRHLVRRHAHGLGKAIVVQGRRVALSLQARSMHYAVWQKL